MPNAEQPNRKRKLQFKASETEAVKQQREGLERQKSPKVKQKATGERKKMHLPTLLKRRKHPNKRAVEKKRRLPKHRLPRMLPYDFLMQIGPDDVSVLKNQSKSSPSLGQLPHRASPLQPVPTTILVGPSDVSTTPTPPFTPLSTFSTSSPLPLTSGNFKYISPPACTAKQQRQESSSMLNLLNSPLDDSPDIVELSYDSPMASGVGNSSPSSVGSLFKDSLDILQQNEAEIWDEATQPEVQCSNCNVLNDKIRELEQKLEIMSE